jgi:hypothetical protein
MDADESLAELKIGDLITLQCAQFEEAFFMEGDGTLDNKLTVSCPPASTHECVFEICARTRVAATEEVVRFLGKLESKPLSSMDPVEREMKKSYLATLMRVKEKENEMNRRFMQECLGTEVVYGDVVQLKHVRSGKFLTASDSRVSHSEPENFEIYLGESASTLSWFSLNPAKAYNNMAEAVINGGEVIISIAAAEQEGECVHVSRNKFVHPNILKAESATTRDPKQKTFEVNASLTNQAWKCSLYCSYTETSSASTRKISAGDIIYFRDPQARAYLQIKEDFRGSTDTECSMVPFGKQHDGDTEETHGSDAYFIAEKADHDALMGAAGAIIGGNMQYGEEIVLRHLNTNLKLHYDGFQLTGKNASEYCDEYVHFESTKSHEPRRVAVGEAIRVFAISKFLRSGETEAEAMQASIAAQTIVLADDEDSKRKESTGSVARKNSRDSKARRLSLERKSARSVMMVASAESATPMIIHRASDEARHDLFFGLAIRMQLDALFVELQAAKVRQNAPRPKSALLRQMTAKSFKGRLLHRTTSTAPPPPHPPHRTTSTAPPPPHHLHRTTSTAPPPPHPLHRTTSTVPPSPSHT